MTLELVADLLDKRIQDRHGRYVGTVDSIVLEIDAHGPPTARAVEVGLPVLLRRVHPVLARLARRFPVTQIPLSRISMKGVDLVADIDAARHPTLLLVETWLRTHVVSHMPGNGR